MIRVAVVDDEQPAREKLRFFLSQTKGLTFMGAFGDPHNALEVLNQGVVDLLFLDMQMPGLSGLELLDRLDPEHMPLVVFCTAHEQYALDAFRVHALDYLLKPFDRTRFEEVLERAKLRLGNTGHGSSIQASSTQGNRLAVREGQTTTFLDHDEIHWLEAARNYVVFHTDHGELIHRGTLSQVEVLLDAATFIRIHRSAMVNVHQVRKLESDESGGKQIVLKSGTVLKVGPSRRDAVTAALLS